MFGGDRMLSGRNSIIGRKKETDSNQINIDENASHIEGKLDEGLFVNAQTDIKSDADWHDNNVILKSWDVDKVSNVFGMEEIFLKIKPCLICIMII